MAFCQIKSSNPELSYVLFKNPNSGMLIRELRKGHLFGWYSNESTFNCFFKDAPNDLSYKANPDDDFEYINTTRYNSAMFVQNTISDFFNSTFKKVHPKDVIGFDNSFFINLIYVNSYRYLEFFNDYFEDFEILYEEVAPKSFKVEFKTKKTLFELLNFVNLFVIFTALKNKDYFVIDDSVVEKNISSLAVIDAPYYIRYMFKVNFLKTRSLFEKFKKVLETSKRERIVLKKGSTFDMRVHDIESRLSFKNPIVDIGCGEGNYASLFAKPLDGRQYYAIDREEKCREVTKTRLDRKNISTYTVLESYDQFKALGVQEKCDILLTEVIEHNEKEVSAKLIQDILEQETTNQIIITTPNKDFNQFYLFDEEEVRHIDHVFEFSENEFKEWISQNVPHGTAKFFNCGDEVNDIPVSLGVCLRRDK